MMLEYTSFHFEIRLIAPAHLGDGRSVELKQFLKADSYTEGGTVLLCARGVDEKPVLEATAFRGAFRAHLEANAETISRATIDELFGARVDTSSRDKITAGKLWFYGGLANPFTGEDHSMMPHWSSERGSFLLPGIRLDPDLGTVADGQLYFTEYFPAGTAFSFEAIFHGDRDQFDRTVIPCFKHLIAGKGFRVGGMRSYGNGDAVFATEALKPTRHFYDVVKGEFARCTDEHGVQLSGEVSGDTGGDQFTFHATTPFLILDPLRSKNDADPDWQTLSQCDGVPHIPGKAILQALRARSSYLESNAWLHKNNYDYDSPDLPVDDASVHLRDIKSLGILTSTQRLFGVAGWAGAVSIRGVAFQGDPKSEDYEGQTIKLDAFTQAPIDGALVSVKTPFHGSLSFRLFFDRRRYEQLINQSEVRKRDRLGELLELDAAQYQRIMSELKKKTSILKIGHATAAGFGWFRSKTAS